METENLVHKLRQALDNASAQLNQVKQLLDDLGIQSDLAPAVKAQIEQVASQEYEGNSQVVEGVFNGQNMVGPDGKIYTVPANYASKSKLVEGDLLKLTIRPDGSFVYKQVGPVERMRVVGSLVLDGETADYIVVVNERSYKVIKAAVTYYKGLPGDEVVLLVPEDGDSLWGAVENVITAGSAESANAAYYEAPEAETLLPDGAEAQLPDGSEAQLPPGSEAELPSGAEAQLTEGDTEGTDNTIDLTGLV